jgi:hypothetical protein
MATMDFSKMTGPQLAAAWNEMVLTAVDLGIPVDSVKKFADQKSGRARCEKLHAQIQEKKSGTVEDDLSIPPFLRRKPGDRIVVPSTPTLAPARRPIITGDKPGRDWRIPKGMSDEEGRAMLARQEESKKQKAAERIKKLQEKKAERDAEKLAQVNAKREAKGLDAITSLTRKPKQVKQETEVMSKSKKSAKAKSKSANGSWMSNDAVITKLEKGKEYDPRKGTTASKLWDSIRNGMTVAAYKEKGKAPAMPYLRWFMAHNYVKVTG